MKAKIQEVSLLIKKKSSAWFNAMLSRVRIVLVGTTHPGNIGAAARAMKNMSLQRLLLVSPKNYPSAEATARASGAEDLLCDAQVYESLDAALHGCRLVVGASARKRSIMWPELTPRACASKMLAESRHGEVALIFGRESSGLSNDELDRCQFLVRIPTNPQFSSLNLSQAVQVLVYELFIACHRDDLQSLDRSSEMATAEMMESFFTHLYLTMKEIGFADPSQSTRLRRRLRRLFFRARPDQEEVNILRGILSAAQGRKSMRKKGT